MKIIYFIGLFCLIYACSQKKSKEFSILKHPIPEIYILKTSQKIKIKNDTLFVNNRKYSGYIYQLNPNNIDTISLEPYYKGLQSGVSKKWTNNKKLLETRSYFNGKKNGKQLAYWENGNKKFEFSAKEDAYEGELKEWNMEGKLIHLANYKEGQEEGTQKLWYDNGKTRANYIIIKGRRYGLLGTKNCTNVSDSIFINK